MTDDFRVSIPMPAPGSAATTGVTHRGEVVVLRAVRVDEAFPADDSQWDDWGDGPRGEMPKDIDRLIVEGGDGVAGIVSWHRVEYGATLASHAWNIGIGLVATARGRGIGPVVQRLLALWLLEVSDLFRIEASTDVANLAEQRALELAGFTREAILRSAQMRRDGRHDLVSYSLLRTDL